MSLSDLPPEVLEVVFSHLDGVSVCLGQSVCKTWRKLLRKMLQDKQIWYRFCIKDIPNDVLEEMLSNRTIPVHNIIEWKSLYKKWYKAKYLTGPRVSIETIQASDTNPVTCMNASGSWIITGHRNGELCTWNQVTGLLSQRIRCHLRAITGFALVDIQTLGTYYGFETMPWSHHHVITVSRDTCIKVKCLLEPLSNFDSDLVLNTHGAPLKSVRIFGNQFIVHCEDNTVSLWSLNLQKQPFVRLEVLLLRTIIGFPGITYGFWKDKIYGASFSKILFVHNSETDEFEEEKYFARCLHAPNGTEYNAKNYFISRDEIIFTRTACGKLIVSTKEGFKAYKLMTFLRTSVVSMALKGTTLALGGDNGRLYLYHVPTTKSLLKIDLTKPAFQHTLSESPIVHLDIQHEENSTIVYATTTQHLYIIRRLSKHDKVWPWEEGTHYFANQVILPF